MFSGEDIRRKRKESGLSARQLADLLQVSIDNLYKWQQGTRPADPEDYSKIEEWLSGKLETKGNLGQFKPQQAGDADYRAKYEALLENTNKALIESIQLSLNALLEGQRDLKVILKTNQQNIDDLLSDNGRELEEVRVQTSKRNASNLGLILKTDISYNEKSNG